jgi:hypothetical protein
MKPELYLGNVRANCPDCGGAVTTFEAVRNGREFGRIQVDRIQRFNNQDFRFLGYSLMSCASCNRGGIAKIHWNIDLVQGELESFFPFSAEYFPLPKGVPKDLKAEFREAENCIAFGSLRGASALFRSTLEKVLKANGYTKGPLVAKIDEAAADGIITDARKRRAHDDIRVLGNDVLHDDWRIVTNDEVDESHHYSQRILEDFYDDRPTVEGILKVKNRITPTP